LKNSLSYIRQTAKGEISIYTSSEKDYSLLYIKDTVLDITKEKLKEIFIPFKISSKTGRPRFLQNRYARNEWRYITLLGQYTLFTLYFFK